MSSKPKTPKPKPINQARIAEVRNTLNQQNQAIEVQLKSTVESQMSNLDILSNQKGQALEQAKLDANRNLLLLQNNRQSLLGYLQTQKQQKLKATNTQTQLRQGQVQSQERQVGRAQNKVAPAKRTMGL
jgi:hypothetical protein